MSEQQIEELLSQRHHLAVEAYKQTDNPTWTRMWDECAELATRAAEIAEADVDTERADSLRRTAENNRNNADVFRGRPNEGESAVGDR